MSILAVVGSDPEEQSLQQLGLLSCWILLKQCSASGEGIVNPNTPILAGSARREHLILEHAGWTSSNGCDELLVYDLLKLFQEVANPWNCPEKAHI